MKLIIDIPDYSLEEVQNGSIASGVILKAVRNGTPINTDGDLISCEALKEIIETYRPTLISSDYLQGKNNMIDYCIAEIDNAPTVEPEELIKPIAEIKCEISEEEKQRIIEILRKEKTKLIKLEPEKVKEGELVKAYTKGFDTGVETVRPQGEWIDHSATFWECPDCGHLLEKCCPNCQKEVVLPIKKPIDNAPTVELERPKSEWFVNPHSMVMKCMNCGHEENAKDVGIVDKDKHFCYWCGADMRGEKK